MIDWAFISAREGGSILVGYVPSDHSGVTIATGIDLTNYNISQLPADLRVKIAPYIGLTGATAKLYLMKHPLVLTQTEADTLEAPKRASMLASLKGHYANFDSLHTGAQTVLMSVTWQYGTPWVRCPNFWKAAIARDWSAVIHELRNFGDAYPTRRNLEADYLEAHP